LDPEKSIDKDLEICTRIVILPNKVGNYDIFKLKEGNDEIVITERLKDLLTNEMESQKLDGIVIIKCESEVK
jgi:hypothetical protein